MAQLTTSTRALVALCAGLVVVTAACGGGGDGASSAPPSTIGDATTVTAAAATGDDAPGDEEPDDATTTSGEPTGRLLLDGEEFALTYDADDPNALCQVLPGGAIVVSGMRTPDGNRVDVTVQAIPAPNVMATYFDDSEVPLWTIASTDSSTEPEFGVEGDTVTVSGRWFHRQDTSVDEVDGELEVTC